MDLPEFVADRLPGAHLVERLPAIVVGTLTCLATAAVSAGFFLHVEVGVDARGTVQPIQMSQVRASHPGIVANVYTATGERVAQGDIVVLLDTLEAANHLRRLLLAYNEAVLTYEQAEASIPHETDRQLAEMAGTKTTIMRARAVLRQRLVEYGMSPNVDDALRSHTPGTHTAIDVAVADVLAAEANFASQKAEYSLVQLSSLSVKRAGLDTQRLREEIELTRAQLARSTIRATDDGVVLTEHVDRLKGKAVGAGDLLLEIAGDTAWRAELHVPGDRVHRIQVGDRVLLESAALRADGRQDLRGTVTFVSPQSIGTEPSALTAPAYLVEVMIDTPNYDWAGSTIFRRGYVVNATIITQGGRLHAVARSWIRDRIWGRN